MTDATMILKRRLLKKFIEFFKSPDKEPKHKHVWEKHYFERFVGTGQYLGGQEITKKEHHYMIRCKGCGKVRWDSSKNF